MHGVLHLVFLLAASVMASFVFDVVLCCMTNLIQSEIVGELLSAVWCLGVGSESTQS